MSDLLLALLEGLAEVWLSSTPRSSLILLGALGLCAVLLLALLRA